MNDALPISAPIMVLRYGALATGTEPMLIAGMFTPSYRVQAERLVGSLRRFNLPYAIFEVPTVHHSISLRGGSDPSYTKANFIWHVLAAARRPVLYLDVDCVVMRSPDLITQLARDGRDFAILNWLTQDKNDAYVPVVLPQVNSQAPPAWPRYYQHSYHVDLVTADQLLCSGAVQWWGDTAPARELLCAWFATIEAQPRVADDECLDFAFNNPVGSWRTELKPFWLSKSYARYPWWIFDEPIINHPDVPSQGGDRGRINDSAGRRMYYPERAKVRNPSPFIPRDCVIDAATGFIWQRVDQQLRLKVERWTHKLWPLPQTIPNP